MASSSSQQENNSDEAIVGFGTNYFHALGGTEETLLELQQDESDHEESTVNAHLLQTTPWDSTEDSLKQIVCSATSTIFLTTEGKIYQTGTLHGRVWTSPTRVEVAFPRKCVEISAGRHFCIAKLEQGIGVVSWGAGHFGQLGLGNHVSSLDTPQIIPHLLPQALGTTRVSQIAAGAWHALALLDNGKCMAWGSNRKSQCGVAYARNNKQAPTICTPQPISFFGEFQKVAAGRLHSMGIEKETGRVYTWGASHYGQCGQYSSRGKSICPPKLVEALQRVVVVDIAAGDAHSLALTGGGRVFCWGSGMDGQLGLGGVIPISRPKLLADLDFVAIEAGREWKQKQLESPPGEPHFRDFATTPCHVQQQDSTKPMPPPPSYNESPVVASHLSTVPKIIQVEAAGAYSVALSSSGHLYTWGHNDVGQMGVPKSRVELPLVEATSGMMKLSSSGRLLQIRSFESQQNLLLPRRVDALAKYRVTDIAVGPCNMWCVATSRPDDDSGENAVTGQTLYEVQEERRRKSLGRMRQRLSSSASASSGSGKLSATILSIQAVSKESDENVPDNVFAHAESTGMDEDGGSTTTFETQLSTGIILPVEGEYQSPTKTPQIQETTRLESPHSGDSLTATSIESPDEKLSPSVTPKSGNRTLETPSSPLSRFMGKRSKSRGKAGRDDSEEILPPQEQLFNGGSPTSPTAASLGPLGFAGGRPQLPISSHRRNKGGRSKSVPSKRSTTPPLGQPESPTSPEPRGLGSGMSVARLMRGRRNPKTPKDEAPKKGRVRKALKGAFGK